MLNRPATAVVLVVVCMLTGSVDPNCANKILFTAREYINGALALGYTVRQHIDPSRTHMLLLLKEGFALAPEDLLRLEAVGWTLGTAPDFQLPPQYVLTYERYTTTYTKITAIGIYNIQILETQNHGTGHQPMYSVCT